MSIVNTYPVFEPDQVLTNRHLNDMVTYLEQQERLTRCKLLGSGIVCGLEISHAPGTINITKGCGLTSQGYIILFCDHIGRNGYKYIMPFVRPPFPKDLNLIVQCGPEPSQGNIPFYSFNSERAAASSNSGLFLLLTQQEFDDMDDTTGVVALTQVQDLDQYAVVLFLDVNELNLKNCDTNDCNDKGSMMDFDIKPLLVHKKLLLDGRGQDDNLKFKHIELRRYNVPVNNLNSSGDVLNAFADLLDDGMLGRLSDDLAYCFHTYKHLLGSEIATNPFGTLAELKHNIQFILKYHPILIQYYYDFIYDLIHALYEFRHRIVEITSECCGDEMRFPFHLTLGEATATSNTNVKIAFRQYFIYSPLFDREGERAGEVRSLLMRMILMYQSFLISEKAFKRNRSGLPESIRITPSQYGHHFLSERCIPYYYRVVHEPQDVVPEDLYHYWNYDKTKRGNARFNLSYRASEYNQAENVVSPLLYDIEWYNFFRVEGHIGKNINTALSGVKSIQQRFNLPFDVVALSADYIGALVRGQDPYCIIQDLESDYRVLIAEFICRLHNAFCYVGKLNFVAAQRTFTSDLFATRARAAATVGTVADTDVGLDIDADTLSALFPSRDEAINVVADHPFVASLVGEFQATAVYTKGDTLSRLCSPAANTFGGTYHSIVQRNAGKFVNPIPANATSPTALLQRHFFEFIDSVESMFQIVMTNELSVLSTSSFKLAYNRFENEVNIVHSSTLGFVKGLAAGRNVDNIMLNNLLDLFVDNKQMLFHTCIVERLEALRSEYQRRLAQYKLAKNFNYYFKKHGGIEHKAGVPRAGTFILVYHEQRRNRFVDLNSIFVNKELSNLMLTHFRELLQPGVKPGTQEAKAKMLAIATLYKDPELYFRFKDVMKKYLDDCKDLTPDTRTAITTIIEQTPEKIRPELTNGMVIADFYVPYICCSDCPPIAYIFEEAPTVTLNKEYCRNDKGPYTIEVNPVGGVIKIDDKEVAGGKLVPSAYKAGGHTVTYTVNGKVARATFEIVVPPKVELTHTTGREGNKIIFKILTDARPVSTYEFDYGDGKTAKSDSRTDRAFIEHVYDVSPGNTKFKVVLTINDGPCKVTGKATVEIPIIL